MKKRPLGQNFLIDDGIANEIVRLAGVSTDDHVLEIGPGRGVLTGLLAGQTGQLTAIEVDPKLCVALRGRFGSHKNFNLLEADALTYDYGSIGPRFKVISNLPYYAATHIMKRLIHYRARIADMTLMLQKEVVDRLAALPGTKEYGSLTVFVQYYCNVERVLEVGKNAFSPPPKVDSSVIRLHPLAHPRVEVADSKTFFKVVNAAFFHKRKMLKNNLKFWEKQFDKDAGKIRLAGIDLARRGETLSLQDFADLSNYIHAHHG